MSKHYENLIAQVNKLYRHNRQGSFKTKERYYEAMQRFCRFLAHTYRLEKLANLAPKHLTAYVAYMKEKGLSPSTIKTDLGAIRFYHDMIPNPRHRKLPENAELDLARRSLGQVDRSWSSGELLAMVAAAKNAGKDSYAALFHLAYHTGLRIHECLRIDTAIARRAVATGKLTIKGKGGKVRQVPITDDVCRVLAELLIHTSPGKKLFVPDGVPTHVVIKSLQAFVRENRDTVMDEGRDAPITFHGLRHSYAANRYQIKREAGTTERAAKKQVSELLGHNRADVTGMYLPPKRASKKEGGEDA